MSQICCEIEATLTILQFLAAAVTPEGQSRLKRRKYLKHQLLNHSGKFGQEVSFPLRFPIYPQGRPRKSFD
jgi:hypothetical protein